MKRWLVIKKEPREKMYIVAPSYVTALEIVLGLNKIRVIEVSSE